MFPKPHGRMGRKIKEMIPSYGISLTENPRLFQDLHTSTGRTLGLNEKKLFIINEEIKNVRYIRTFFSTKNYTYQYCLS